MGLFPSGMEAELEVKSLVDDHGTVAGIFAKEGANTGSVTAGPVRLLGCTRIERVRSVATRPPRPGRARRRASSAFHAEAP